MRKKHIHIFLLVLILNFVNIYSHPDDEHRSAFSRFWHSLFGSRTTSSSSGQKCPNCQNQLPYSQSPNNDQTQYIEDAYLTQGDGSDSSQGGGAPAIINNLHGNPSFSGGGTGGGISDEVLKVIAEEQTKQIELLTKRDLLLEHERNQWFATLQIFMEEMRKAQEEDRNDKFLQNLHGMLSTLMAVHHDVLHDLEVKRGENELKKEKIRQKNLPQLLEHDLKTKELEHRNFLEKLSHIGQGILTFTGDKQRMTTAVCALSGLALATYASKHGTKVAANYVSSVMLQPALVIETSRISPVQFLRHPIKNWMKRTEELPTPIYNASLLAELDEYVISVKENKQYNQPFRNLFLFGKPGTGKTLFIKTMAHKLGMHYAIIPGSNFQQFNSEESVKQVHKLFDWAERPGSFLSKGRRKTLLFFDEADSAVPPRGNNDKTDNITNAILTRTGTETDKYLFAAASNNTEIDPAFESRLDKKICIPLPDEETRKKLLRELFNVFVKRTANCQDLKIEDNFEDTFHYIAYKTDGFSGRGLSQLVRSLPAKAYITPDRVLRKHMVQPVVEQALKGNSDLENYSMKN